MNTPILDPNKRKAVSEYERTISTLASAAETRTYLSDAPPNGVSGCYDYRHDRIILYPAIEALDTTVIALEEAGHSQERDTYRTHEKETLSFVSAALKYPGARGFLDWFEDWRVFNLLGKRFPGAVRLFRSHWELRAAFVRQVCASPEGKPVDACMLRIAERYLTDPKKAPETYKGTLRAAWAMLRELETPPPSPQDPGPGNPGQSGEKSGDQPGATLAKSESKDGPDEDDSTEDSTEDEETDAGGGDEDEQDEDGDGSPDRKGEKGSGAEDEGDSGGGSSQDAKANGRDASRPDVPNEPSDVRPPDAGPGGDKGGVGGPDAPAPLSPELAPYVIGVVLLVGDEAGERLNESKDWRLNRQTVRYTRHKTWKQVDSALFEPRREDR